MTNAAISTSASTSPATSATSRTANAGDRTARLAEERPTVSPLVDVFENAHEILLLADVPGASRDSVEVHVDKGHLTLSARRAASTPTTGAKWTPLELEHRDHDYHRVFAVPTGIDAAKIEAELTSGVLKVRLPKSDALRPRKIEVKAG